MQEASDAHSKTADSDTVSTYLILTLTKPIYNPNLVADLKFCISVASNSLGHFLHFTIQQKKACIGSDIEKLVLDFKKYIKKGMPFSGMGKYSISGTEYQLTLSHVDI